MKKIKMRLNKNEECICSSCGNAREQVLDMFDVRIGKLTFTICDECNEVLFAKSLKATCLVNERVKTQADLAIIKKRKLRDKLEG